MAAGRTEGPTLRAVGPVAVRAAVAAAETKFSAVTGGTEVFSADLSSSRLAGALDSALLSDEDALAIADIACSELSPAEFDAMDSWDLFCLACFLVTDGMSYAARPVSALLTRGNDDGDTVGPRLERQRFRDRVANLELRVVSMLAVFKDLRSPAWVAHRALRGRWRGLCRHYVTAVQAVHNALKLRSSAHDGTFVVPIIGRASPWSIWAHAWLWWVDPPSTRRAAMHSSTAATLRRCSTRAWTRPRSRTYPPSRSRCWCVHPCKGVAPVGPEARLLTRLLDPKTAHGQIRLYQLSRHPVGSTVRTSILDCLKRRGFRNAYPGYDFGRSAFDRSDGRDGFLIPEHVDPFVGA